MDFLDETVTDLAARVRAKQVSARELVSHALSRIEEVDASVGAFVALDPDGALAAARQLDEAIAAGGEGGPLAGIPIGVKDLEDAAGMPTGKGIAAFSGRPPVGSDSVLVARLKAAGCIVVGKTNTPALGHKADTTTLVSPPTRNPWNLERSPGGLSGGSAAAVAAGMVPLATGSDGGGSIRIPASLCGLSGMKPSLGRVPSGGSEPPDWQHLSTKGPMARSIFDVVAALDAVVGPDQSDLRSLPMPDVPWAAAVRDAGVPLRVAWSPTLGYATPDPEVLAACQAAVERLEQLGAEVVEVDTVFDTDPVLTWVTLTGTYLRRTLLAAGALRSDGSDSGAPDSEIDETLRPQLELAASFSAVDLARAEDECHRMNRHLVELFADVRLLVTPTVASLAPLSGRPGVIAGEEAANWVQYTYPFNCTRSPAGTVPVGVSTEGTPIGLPGRRPPTCRPGGAAGDRRPRERPRPARAASTLSRAWPSPPRRPVARRAIHRPPTGDLVLIAVAVAAVSTSAPLIRYAAAPALAIALWRNVMASGVLVPVAAVAVRRELAGMDGRQWRLAALAGVLLGGHFAAWVPSLSFTTVASSVALVATQPVWAALIAHRRGMVVPRAAWVGIGVAVTGAAVLSGVDLQISVRALYGDVLALVGGALAAAYVTVGAEVRASVSTTAYTTVCYATAAAVLLAVCLATGQQLTGYPASTWWALAGLTAGAQLLGHSVFNRVLRTTGPTVISVAILFEIAGAAVLAWLWFGETPPAAAAPAAGLIALGVVLVVRAGREPSVVTPVME